jgi:hypothetical protein
MNQKRIEGFLEKILTSSEFAGSDNYNKLLHYLVKKSSEGISPKESTIAIEVFDKDLDSENFDSSSVRVYMHNLRQKLNSYYSNEGREDEIRLRIPKGHYLVKFDDTKVQSRRDYSRILIFSNIISLFIILVGIFFFLFKYNPTSSATNKSSTTSKIWNEYINDDKPILLVFGDYYLYEDLAEPRIRYIRDFKVNSDEDFQNLLLEDSEAEENYRLTEHTLLGKFALTCLVDLNNFFISYGKRVDITIGSSLQWEDLNRNNVIFVGSFKTLRLLKNLLNNHHFEYLVHPNTLIFKDTVKDSTYSYQAPKNHTTGQVKDYAIFSRFPGPNHNVITLFSSTHDVGHISTVRHFTNLSMLEQFENENLIDDGSSNFFDALFEVEGYARTGFQPKLLHLIQLDQN